MKNFDLGYAIGRIVRYILSKTIGKADDEFMEGFNAAMSDPQETTFPEAINRAKEIAISYTDDPEVKTIIEETADIMVTEPDENLWDDIQSWLSEVGAIWKQWKQSRQAKRAMKKAAREDGE